MQTVTLQIREERLEQFLKIIDALKEDMVEEYLLLPKDETAYLTSVQFQKDRERLQARLEDISSGKATLLTEDLYREKMDGFISDLKRKYADS